MPLSSLSCIIVKELSTEATDDQYRKFLVLMDKAESLAIQKSLKVCHKCFHYTIDVFFFFS